MSETASRSIIQTGVVTSNTPICREHLRLRIHVEDLPPALPGQFVHLCPDTSEPDANRTGGANGWSSAFQMPMLRRAFSIAHLQIGASGTEFDVIYRVVGTGTKWMSSLGDHDTLSVLGPLGKPFPIDRNAAHAFLVSGGVGLPPMLWLAEALRDASVPTVAFCGAQTTDLLALSIDATIPPARDASLATLSAREFSVSNTPVVISTDDGSLGFHGHVGQALDSYYQANAPSAEQCVIYTCGPEKMMRFVADFCAKRGIRCFVCMERSMACGMGTCQSCVVPIDDDLSVDGFRYALCCKEGPVFDARQVRWD